MVQGAQIAGVIAGDVLMDANFVEPGIVLHHLDGQRNQYGEFERGRLLAFYVSMVSTPVTGQERIAALEGLRDEDLRTFYVSGVINGLHYGLADGDLIVHGNLGPVQNTFTATTREAAERARDVYGQNNPTWLATYQMSNANMIRLTGFGVEPTYQRYYALDDEWIDADCYRAVRPKNWGAFTEVVGVRQDPGNKG